jgi:hypothetical protein
VDKENAANYNVTDKLEGRKLVELIDRHLDETLMRNEEGSRPIWESQVELGKSLMSLASGALVLSISVVQFLADKIKQPHWTWLLTAAWILFALTVLLGASRQAWLGTARSVRANFEPQRSEIRAKLWELKESDDIWNQVDAILTPAFEKAQVQPAHGIKVFGRLTLAMYWSFAIGLIFLLAFAIRNLPF